MAEIVKYINCAICGGDNYKIFYTFSDYQYVKCNNCSLIYQNPQPVFKELKKRYTQKYFEYEYKNQENFFELMRLSLQDINFFDIKFEDKTPKFLDIGCATGMLLDYIRSHGFSVKGVELCPQSVNYAKKRFKLDIFCGTLKQAKFKAKSFDVVHLSHLIEHLNNPKAELEEIYRILKPDGIVLVTTPRIDSFQAKLFGKNWRCFHKDHLYIFSKKTLIKILRLCKFEIIKHFSWGGLAKEKAPSRILKYMLDNLVKLINFGDVQFVYAIRK